MKNYWKTPDEVGGWYIITDAYDVMGGWYYKKISHCQSEEEAERMLKILNNK